MEQRDTKKGRKTKNLYSSIAMKNNTTVYMHQEKKQNSKTAVMLQLTTQNGCNWPKYL